MARVKQDEYWSKGRYLQKQSSNDRLERVSIMLEETMGYGQVCQFARLPPGNAMLTSVKSSKKSETNQM
jgi:hypothetical protein